jgi:hypothetical protein
VVLEETSQIVIQLDTLADFQLKRNTQATNSTLLRIDGNLAVPNDVNAQIGLSDISAGLNISVVVATFTGSFSTFLCYLRKAPLEKADLSFPLP